MTGRIRTAIAVVIFSALIWVFAERAVIKTAVVEVQVSLYTTRPDRLVQFLDTQGQPSDRTVQRVRIEVEGPAGRIQQINEGKLTPRIVRRDINTLGFAEFADAEYHDFTPRVLDLLTGRVVFEEANAYLVAREAKPPVLQLRIRKLTPVNLDVVVYDEYGTRRLPIEQIEPARVRCFVANGSPPAAQVNLTAAQQRQATQKAITVKAQIPGLANPSQVEVQIKLAPEGSSWPVEEIARPRIGICKPGLLEGKYRVVPEDLDAKLEAYAPIRFQGPPSALAEYKNASYHLLLEVKEEDLNSPSPARPLRYYLPPGESSIQIIKPVSEPVRFRLEKIEP
ncbi:MAG: hypothetical protein JW810_02785 [Sedimentisphaerales bacterium]|nr:hypothetical protein [Sedimentisphaerales bacterium]